LLLHGSKSFLMGVFGILYETMKILRSFYILAGRFQFLPAVLAVTLLGGAVGSQEPGWRLGIAVLSNFLLYCFAMIYQNIETAPAAAIKPNKAQQNPIASGEVSMQLARTLAAVTALLSLTLFALIGSLSIVLGILGLLIAFALSNHNLKLGNSALMRLGKHQPLLSVIFGLSGFLAVSENLTFIAILLSIFLLSLGFLFAALTAENTTRSLSRVMLLVLMVFATGAAYELFIVFEAIQTWVLLLTLLLMAALALVRLHFNPQHQKLSQILFDALALSTSLSLIISYLTQIFI